jgi:hypothetical protein
VVERFLRGAPFLAPMLFADMGTGAGFIEMQYIPLGYNEFIDGTIDNVRILVSNEQALYYAPDLNDYYLRIKQYVHAHFIIS